MILRGILGQYLGCFMSLLLSKAICNAVSMPCIIAAPFPYRSFISAVLRAPGLSLGASTVGTLTFEELTETEFLVLQTHVFYLDG